MLLNKTVCHIDNVRLADGPVRCADHLPVYTYTSCTHWVSLRFIIPPACIVQRRTYHMEPSLGIFGSLPMQAPSRFTFIFNCQILDTFLNFLSVPNDHIFILIVPNMAVCKNVVGTDTSSTHSFQLPDPVCWFSRILIVTFLAKISSQLLTTKKFQLILDLLILNLQRFNNGYFSSGPFSMVILRTPVFAP